MNRAGLRWYGLAMLSGAIGVLGFAPFGWWPLTLVSLSCCFFLICRAASAGQAARLGWTWGLAYFCAGIHWLYISLHDFGGMPAAFSCLSVMALAAFLALYPALAAWFARRFTGPHHTILALPACWTLCECLRAWLFTGFPWLSVGYSQISAGPLAAYAPILGIYGVGMLLAVLAALPVWLLQQGPNYKRLALPALLMAGLLLTCGQLLRKIEWTQAYGQPIRVALLQGGIPQDKKWDARELGNTLVSYYHQVEQAQGDLIVLPETAFPILLHELPPDYRDALLDLAQKKHAALITGVARMDLKTAKYYNAAVLLTDPKQPMYFKSHLVPFGEFVPFPGLIGWIYEVALNMPLSGFTPGLTNQAPFEIAGQRIAADICYEDVFGEELIEGAKQGTVLLNLSNLAWYDPSIASAQHGQMAQARAIEMGRSFITSTNTGLTAAIGPHGEIIAALPVWKPGVLNTQVQGYSGQTPYMRWGNAMVLGLCLTALLAVFWMRHKRSV